MTNDPHKPAPGGEALSYQSPRVVGLAAPSRSWKPGEILCWIVILLIVGLISVRAALYQERRAAALLPTPQFPGVSKYAVATHALFSKAPAFNAGTSEQLLNQLSRMAKTPAEKMRLAIIYGEFQGADAAADRLGEINDPANDPEFTQDLTDVKSIYALRTDHIPVPEIPEGPGIPRLRKRLGWFADLAISHAKADTDPLRQKVLSDAYVAFFVIAGGEFFLLLVGVTGLVLLIIAIVQLARRKLRLAFRSVLESQTPRADRHAYLEGFTLYLVTMVVAGYGLQRIIPWPMLIAALELPLAFAVGLLWPLFRGESTTQWRATLGLHTGRGIVREIFSGITGYITGIPLMGLGALVVVLLMRIAKYTPTHPIEQELGGTGEILFTFFLASVWAPVTEELMFRGALFSSLRERYSWWISAPVMALVFAGIHPQGYVAVPVLAAIAVTFAGIREWRGSILGSMAAHAMHNTAALAVMLFLMRS